MVVRRETIVVLHRVLHNRQVGVRLVRVQAGEGSTWRGGGGTVRVYGQARATAQQQSWVGAGGLCARTDRWEAPRVEGWGRGRDECTDRCAVTRG